MKKEASDLEAKVEKMMMEKVRALFFSAPPFCGFFSPAAGALLGSAAGLDVNIDVNIVCAAQDKVLSKMEADIDVEALKLRELRGKMVGAGIYKSWCAPAPPSAPTARAVSSSLCAVDAGTKLCSKNNAQMLPQLHYKAGYRLSPSSGGSGGCGCSFGCGFGGSYGGSGLSLCRMLAGGALRSSSGPRTTRCRAAATSAGRGCSWSSSSSACASTGCTLDAR